MLTNSRKKICFIVSSFGTARSFLQEPFKYLAKEFDIYLVANIKESDDLSDMYLTGHKSIPIERRPNLRYDYIALNSMISYFKEMKFDSVHSLTKKASLLTTIAGRIANIPYRLHHFTGQMWTTMHGLRKFIYKHMDTFIVWSDTHMLVDGFSQMEFLEDTSILRKGEATVLANGSICGINTNRFSPDSKIREELRSNMQISNDTVVYIFLGRLKREKGIYELLAAFNQLTVEAPNAVLLLVGKDEENCIESLPNYSNIHIGKNLIFYGFTPRPEDLYRAADVYVLPTYREGFGLSILEASCSGLPVITTDTYGVRDSIIDNETGLRCKTYDIETLKNAMLQLYTNESERKRLGDNGIKYVHENFTTEIVCNAWLEYYKKVLQ